MADVITRLKVESSEYESKIQRAAKGIQHLEETTRRAGKTMSDVSGDELKFVQQLGKMETVSSDARGKIAELTKAFTNLSVQYKNLTEEEKKSPFGKAMSQSLDQLQTRIKEGKSELSSIDGQLTNTGDAFKQLANKIGIPAELFTKLGFSLAAASAAAKIATDAFRQNDQLMDEWGRTMESASSLYDGFLTALNTGDFSSFFQNIQNIVNAARAAYDALDELGTFNAFNQINVQKAQTGFTEAITSFREGKGSVGNVQSAADALKKELGDRMDREKDVYLKAISDLAETKTVDPDMLQKALSGTYGDYQTLKATPLTGTKTIYHAGAPGTAGYATQVAVPANEIEKLAQVLQQLDDKELEHIQSLGAQAERTATEIAQIDKQVARVLGQKGVTPGTNANGDDPVAGSIKAQEAEVARLTELWKNATDEFRDGYKAELDDAKRILDQMVNKTEQMPQELTPTMNGPERTPLEQMQQSIRIQQADAAAMLDENTLKTLMGVALQNGIDGLDLDFSHIMDDMREGFDIPPETWQALEDKINEQLAALNLDPIKLDVNTGALATATGDAKNMASSWAAAAHAVSAVGSAMQMIDDPTAKIAGIVAEAIANVAAGLGQMLAMPQSTAQSWGWIALAISGTATMISTIAAIKSATAGSYAQGGIIPGNSFSGDKLTANVNSGELILNRAQQDTIAAQLQGGGNGGGVITGTVTGSTIYLALANFAKQNNKLAGSTTGSLVLKIE